MTNTNNKKKTETTTGDFGKLLDDKAYLNIPNAGDIIKGKIISVTKKEIRIDCGSFTTGIVRGKELFKDPGLLEFKPGDEVEATVVEIENENGEMELSLSSAGQKRAWDKIREAKEKNEPVAIYVLDANKGGLIGSFEGAQGFLPVSQLNPEHYPRVSGGDKTKIFEKLKSFVGQKINVKILDADEKQQKLIFSEKNLWEEEQKNIIERYKPGNVVLGEISALADFGAFVKFDDLEGLIHISEIAWQRIDHPSDLLKVGQKIKAEIVSIEKSKIFLSIKKLNDDPWKKIEERYTINQTVSGKILKVNPFGFFVELDHDIHGLAHVSELGLSGGQKPEDIAKPGDEVEFKIISIEPEFHRLGLSLKAFKKTESAPAEQDKKEEKSASAPVEEKTNEAPVETEGAEKKEKKERKKSKKTE